MRQRVGLLAAASCAAALGATAAANATSTSNHPDVETARHNAFALFNSVHSAMRQWGSSVNHNGMSFFLATAPEGSTFYHGGVSRDPPDTFEWLAFEIEHASNFARCREEPQGKALPEAMLWHREFRRQPASDTDRNYGPFLGAEHLQRPIATTEGDHDDDNDDDDDDGDQPPEPGPPPFRWPARGYLQIYRANRPLNLVYIDGQAAANSRLGTLDSQDLILLDYDEPPSPLDDWKRARDMCALRDEWAPAKIDGFIRMEAGFEIVYCDFAPAAGLDLVSVQASPFRNESGIDASFGAAPDLEWMRAAAARYHGHPAGRLDVDWSSMVSAFAHPAMNLTNPDRDRRDLPRAVNASRAARRRVHDRLAEVVAARGGRGAAAATAAVVNWQAVADKIVTRFGERLRLMVEGRLAGKALLGLVGSAVDPFISYTDHSPGAVDQAVDRCTRHYFDPAILRPEAWTPEDRAVAAAVERVSYTICHALFSARDILRSSREIGPGVAVAAADPAGLAATDPHVDSALAVIRELVGELRWSTWKECGRCASLDEICFLPMFPLGGKTDYFNPRCKNITGMVAEYDYWDLESWWT